VTRRTALLALLLLLAAGAFRLWATEHARFTGDEADYWAKSRRTATGRFVPIYGPEITGSEAHLPGPAYYYLMAVPQALTPSPRAGSIFVAALHLLAGALMFLLLARARGPRAGLIGLALFAFAPWDVLYADRIWGSAVVPVWGALAFYAAERSPAAPRWQGVLLFLSLVLPQLHLSVPVLWAACLALLLLRPPRRWGWAALAVGLVLTVAAYGPPLWAELRSGFANSRLILAKGGGAEPLEYAVWNPLRVLGYAVLYGSGEIGYHFGRGYWGGTFDDAAAYLTLAGWGRFFARYGVAWGTAGLVSLALAAVGWGVAVAGALGAGVRALRARRRDALSLEHALTLALTVGFVGGGVLLLVARKRFFPHYANILMPMALIPVALGVDRVWARARAVVAPALAVGVAFMAVSAGRYYLEVDRLNGLAATLDMVGAALEDGAPAQVRFTHFHNGYAWGQVAETYYGRALPHDPRGRVQWIVHNDAPADENASAARSGPGAAKTGGPGSPGPGPDDAPGRRIFDGVWLERRPPTGGAPLEGSAARRGWRRFQVEAVGPDGVPRPCRPDGEERCMYGDQPWQRFGPDVLTMGGAERLILFLHPIQGATVRATYPLPAGTRGGALRYGLSDGAVASDNREPVQVVLREGSTPLGAAAAGNTPGLHTLPFTRTTTAAGALTLELSVAHEGARIFGFDLEL
jgi:hypothetical protein